MQTQHNVFIRKFGKLAIVITVTDWEDFKELEKHANEGNNDPDFLLSGITNTGNIYNNLNPSMLISTRGEVKDITEDTCGTGLASILTGNSPAGPLWQFRKIDGICAVHEMTHPKL
jgi:hypothetical protein